MNDSRLICLTGAPHKNKSASARFYPPSKCLAIRCLAGAYERSISFERLALPVHSYVVLLKVYISPDFVFSQGYKKCSAMWKNSPAGGQLKNKYDLFEKGFDKLTHWRESVLGFQLTRRRLQALSQISEQQYFAIDLTTGEVLAFISKRAMLMDSSHFQKLKDEARAVLIRYGKDGSHIFGENRWLACAPKWAN